jgi:hypothetical protein
MGDFIVTIGDNLTVNDYRHPKFVRLEMLCAGQPRNWRKGQV